MGTRYRLWVRRWQAALSERRFVWLAATSIVVFCASVVVSFFAIGYATVSASNYVTDIVLSNIPVFDVDALFVWGSLLLVVTVIAVLLVHPKTIPFVLFSLALFYFIRSGFTVLTHLGPYPVQSDFSYNVGTLAGRFLAGKDMFFSGHTGSPFLLSIVFWRSRFWHAVFLAWSVFMATIVLLGHLHYSIDVAAAFFITYSIYQLALWMFPVSREIFLADEVRGTAL